MNSCCIEQFENLSHIAPKGSSQQVKNNLDKFGIRNTLHYIISVNDIGMNTNEVGEVQVDT